ncbi:hypothetical protein VroAM7_02370 [Vibrio rotiferianus]|uniref:Uncharacterized protein n=1 Tax=Vibrio rotiferianus TaxID=190895 RepID=A0A510I1W0_9VIBR|nr:hypothetical protein VroAM7_02370 [Vibrio rotiferianus]
MFELLQLWFFGIVNASFEQVAGTLYPIRMLVFESDSTIYERTYTNAEVELNICSKTSINGGGKNLGWDEVLTTNSNLDVYKPLLNVFI